MVGLNGCPRLFGNALDDHRRVLFQNAPDAERVRTEFLGDPCEPSDQRRPSDYKAHVPDQLRKRPHSISGEHNDPPAHTMLAAYSSTSTMLNFDQPSSEDVCVIVTQISSHNGVVVSVWQRQRGYPLADGMTFNLLDRMDGNVPALVTCGVLRIDETGVMPDAPKHVHQLWQQAEKSWFERSGIFGVVEQEGALDQCLECQLWWWQGTRYWQRLQQLQPTLSYQLQQPYQQPILQPCTPAILPQLWRQAAQLQQNTMANRGACPRPKKRPAIEAPIQNGTAVRKRGRSKVSKSTQQKTPPNATGSDSSNSPSVASSASLLASSPE